MDKICRFCNLQLNENNIYDKSAKLLYNCNNIECITAYKYTCFKIFSCLHYCYLSNTSTSCFCIVPNCNKNKINLLCNDFKNNDNFLCCICYDSLLKYPCIVLDCKHIFHHKCFSMYLNKNKLLKGSDISFSFLKCFLCNIPILNIKNHLDFQIIIDYYKDLMIKIDNIIYSMIENDEISVLNYPELTDPDSIYFNNFYLFGKEKFQFILCYRCEEPYFGGLKSCLIENTEEIVDNIVNNIENKICINCIDSNDIEGIIDCVEHGRNNICFKCRFCCNEASHFCFGTTHFCEDCHYKQLTGDLLTSKKLSELPKCNKYKCFLLGNHPVNGKEYAIGCSLCKLK